MRARRRFSMIGLLLLRLSELERLTGSAGGICVVAGEPATCCVAPTPVTILHCFLCVSAGILSELALMALVGQPFRCLAACFALSNIFHTQGTH
uniref:Putative secreted protein n=1 Tax=Anopheles darlingi TaxID=43151 RepID=A0A2M4D9F2_ANODA